MSENNKKCKYCGKLLARRRKGRKLESLRDFKRRNFCDKVCAGKHTRDAKSFSEEKQKINDAVADLSSDSDEKKQDAIEFLTDVFNDDDADLVSRINAAKAVAPYTHKKAESGGGKKEERADKAKQASTGRFSAGSAPGKMARVK